MKFVIYEIYNEPMQISWEDDVKPYSEELVKTIRAFDPDNIIIIGTTTWSQDVDIASENPLEGDNLVYSLHYYASSHKQGLRDKAQKALDNGAALFVSEYGTTEYTGDGFIDTVQVNAWFDFLEENKISWCNWSIGDKAEASAALLPGADAQGGWTDDEISFSGHIVRSKIRSYNSRLFPAYEE
jgi:endoglucanase